MVRRGVEGSSPSKLFGGSQCSVPALPVEAVKDIELSHGYRPNRPATTAQTHKVDASAAVSIGVEAPTGVPMPCKTRDFSRNHAVLQKPLSNQKSLQIRRFMAPGGIEPPHAASKAAALSAELRGRARKSVSLDSLRCSAPAVAVAQLVELRVVVPVVAGSSPVRHPSSQARLERERHARARNGNVLATTRRSS